MSIKHNIWTLSAMYLAGEMNDKQQEEFCRRIENDLSVKNEFEKMKKTWNTIEPDRAPKQYDSGKAWRSLKDRLEQDGLLADQPPARRQIPVYLVRIAAGVLLILSIGIPVLYLNSKDKINQPGIISQEAEAGSSILNLPDNSRIYLNEGSGISYAKESYTSNRSVKLTGEAYFEVRPDTSSPFQVIINNSIVTVLGTSFNVKENRIENKVEVFVESGKVRLQNRDEQNGITLTPGQFGESDGKITGYISQKDLNYLSWKTKEFKFTDVRLDEILRTLENAYHVEINSDIPEITSKRLTSTYSQQTIEVILETICTAFNLNYTKTGKNYQISNN